MSEKLNCSFTSDDSASTADSGIDVDICFETDASAGWRPKRLTTINWSLMPITSVKFQLPEDWNPFPFGLDQYWIAGFVDLFTEYLDDPHRNLWTLHPVSEQGEAAIPPTFRSFVHTTKVRFLCEKHHGWTSKTGDATFWFGKDPLDSRLGKVYFKLCRQKCMRCDKKDFEISLWYPEDIENVLRYLKAQVDFWHYGGLIIPPCHPVLRPYTKRSKAIHRFDCCQACMNGTCTALIDKDFGLEDSVVPLPALF